MVAVFERHYIHWYRALTQGLQVQLMEDSSHLPVRPPMAR